VRLAAQTRNRRPHREAPSKSPSPFTPKATNFLILKPRPACERLSLLSSTRSPDRH
jgi:hypothetical protein